MESWTELGMENEDRIGDGFNFYEGGIKSATFPFISLSLEHNNVVIDFAHLNF